MGWKKTTNQKISLPQKIMEESTSPLLVRFGGNAELAALSAQFRGLQKTWGDMDVSENRVFSPQIIHFNRSFPLFSPSILGENPYFWKHPYGC